MVHKSYLNKKINRKADFKVPDDRRHIISSAVFDKFHNDKSDVQEDEQEGKDTEVDMLHSSSELPVGILLVKSPTEWFQKKSFDNWTFVAYLTGGLAGSLHSEMRFPTDFHFHSRSPSDLMKKKKVNFFSVF